MALIFKSKLYREEIKHWALICLLLVWASLATALAIANKQKIILIAVGGDETRIITENKDHALKSELKNFVQAFLQNYYGFTESTFDQNMSIASDLMSEELWERQKPKIQELKTKMKPIGLSQGVEILSLDQIDQNKIEGIINLTIHGRALDKIIKIKVNITFAQIPRSEQNPWGYEMKEVSDALL